MIKSNGAKLYWIGPMTTTQSITKDATEDQTEVIELKKTLAEHVDALDQVDEAIFEFLDWIKKSPVQVPRYATEGLRRAVGQK